MQFEYRIYFGTNIDILVPISEFIAIAEKRSLPTQLDGFAELVVITYSLESTIKEKFDAIIARMELGSWMKDYYDIYYLANTYTFDARKLQMKCQHFIMGTLHIKIEFTEVLQSSNNFIGPIFNAIVKEEEVFGIWNPQLLKFE